MVQQITVMDENGTQIGMTFPKRAKQLINKQRALWKDETHTAICLLPEVKTEETRMEEIILDYKFANKSEEWKETSEAEKGNELLLHLAKERVKERKRLIKHIVTFGAAWLMLTIFFLCLIGSVRHPLYSDIQEYRMRLHDVVKPAVPEADRWIVEEASWIMERSTYDYIPFIWYIIIGIMIAWGAWIASGLVKCAMQKRQAMRIKKSKPDPVALEYQRLKEMASGGMEIR